MEGLQIQENREAPCVEAIVAYIDSEKHDAIFYRIGLPIERVYDLGITFNDRDGSGTLLKRLGKEERLNSERETGARIDVGYEGKMFSANVYCAIGQKRIGGEMSRLSLKLAKDLGVKKGKKITLHPPKNIRI